MKTIKLIPTTLLLLLAIGMTAQQGINYKALIKDGGGNVVANQNITVQFTILQGIAETNVYQETHSPTTDDNGVFVVFIGEGTLVSGVFANIDWGSDTHALKTEVDTGSGLVDLGTTEFKAVPYALNVANAATNIDELIDGKSDSDGTQDGSSIFLGINAGSADDSSDNRNVGIGLNALKSNTTGAYNTATGYNSLFFNTTGNYNTANGYYALLLNTGNNNTATGFDALYSNSTGWDNTANGFEALSLNTTGTNNTANGTLALWVNSIGIFNTANGAQSLRSNTTGNNNTAYGADAGFSNISGNGNVFIGNESGYNETNSNTLYIENADSDANNALIYGQFGADNTTTGNILRTNSEFQIGNPTGTGYAFPTIDGTSSQILQTDGNGNVVWTDNLSIPVQNINNLADGKSDNDGTQNGSSVFLGFNAGVNDNSSDNQNVGIGLNSLFTNSTGSHNTAEGYRSLYSNTEGSDNTANGWSALYSNITGTSNTANGNGALYFNTIGFQNTANGNYALYKNTEGDSNTANGHHSLYNNSTGIENTANGHRALFSNTIGYQNTANGFSALFNNTEGYSNTANGWSALFFNTTGLKNTANGYQALSSNTEGDNNTAVGYFALFNNTTGSNNIAIGYFADVPNATGSNQIRIGNASIQSATTQVAWTFPSDKRWKEQIRELPYGLELLKQLKPVDYIRKNNDAKTRDMGFIAQDVEALLTKVGYTDQGFLTKDDKGYISLRYNDFIALLTKAIQEQQEIIEKQNIVVKSQQNEINSILLELVETQESQKTMLARLQQLETSLKTEQ